MKIVDCFTFYNELGLLSLRLKTLDKAVDFFVIAEMAVTHSGVYKGFVLEPFLDGLPVSRDRIIYVKVNDYPAVDAREEDQRWVLENFQRNAIERGVQHLDVVDDDIVIVSDLDEIPDPTAIPVMIEGLKTHETVIFCQSHRKYFLNGLSRDYPANPYWLGSVAASVGYLRRSSAQEMRRGGSPQPRAAFIWTTGRTEGAAYIDRGGWHLTYFNGPDMERVKRQSIVEGAQAHVSTGFNVPPQSRHNWREGRTEQVQVWRDSLDVDVLLVDPTFSTTLRYVPSPVAEDPRTWEWLWWLDTPFEAVDKRADEGSASPQGVFSTNTASSSNEPKENYNLISRFSSRPPQVVRLKGEDVTFAEWEHPLAAAQSLPQFMNGYMVEKNWSTLISPGDVCVDVGAHCGDSTLAMAICAFRPGGDRATVLAVEPNQDVYPFLSGNAESNAAWADIRLSKNAVTKMDNQVVVLLDHGNENCNGGIVDDDYSEAFKSTFRALAKTETSVTGFTLETICRQNLSDSEIARLKFIKTDCEGYDKEIIRSSRDFIRQHNLVVFVEWFDLFNNGDDFNDFFTVLSDLDFVVLNPATLRPHDLSVKISDLVLVPRSHPLAIN
jgi:beta-1,4-mannosyl-glycoprotein beta-1,4-N-acetylglucosaminyltransferase